MSQRAHTPACNVEPDEIEWASDDLQITGLDLGRVCTLALKITIGITLPSITTVRNCAFCSRVARRAASICSHLRLPERRQVAFSARPIWVPLFAFARIACTAMAVCEYSIVPDLVYLRIRQFHARSKFASLVTLVREARKFIDGEKWLTRSESCRET